MLLLVLRRTEWNLISDFHFLIIFVLDRTWKDRRRHNNILKKTARPGLVINIECERAKADKAPSPKKKKVCLASDQISKSGAVMHFFFLPFFFPWFADLLVQREQHTAIQRVFWNKTFYPVGQTKLAMSRVEKAMFLSITE